MAKSCIYKIESPSGRVYIGQTNNLNRRIIEHKYMSSNSNLKLHNSIKKYGISNHDIKPIFISDCDYEKDIMEALYIRHYDSVDNGLNHLYIPGVNNGFKGKKHSVDNVLKIKKRMKGFTPVKAINKNKKRVYCEANNMTFDSISDCARYFNVSHSYISIVLSGSRTNKLNIKLS